MRAATLSLMVLLGMHGAAHADRAYRWVDADGKVHYGDQLRPGAEAVKLRSGTTFEAPSKPAASATAPAGDDASGVADGTAPDCAQRKQQLESFRKSVRIVEKNALGEEREYSEQDRARLIELTEQQVAQSCDEAG